MTKARILADYVAGGTTAAEFDYLDGLTSAAVGINDTQTLTNKTLTTPNLGTPSAITLTNATFPADHVLQVKITTMGDRLVISDTDPDSWQDITGLSVQITPSSSSNKILVFALVQGSSAQNIAFFVRTMRDSTEVGIGNASSSRGRYSSALKEISSYDIQTGGWNFLDSPATTSQLTYKIQVYGNGTNYINGPSTSSDNWSVGNVQSSITVMEIKG